MQNSPLPPNTSKLMRLSGAIDVLEETLIALILALMTLVTFANVVLRYVFNESLIWGLEVVLILFAWLVFLGISYGFKKTSHLGVDALTNALPERGQRIAALLSALACLAYAMLLMKGAWDYWAPFAALQPTEGRWFPLGFTENTRDRAFYVTDQVPMLGIFRWLEDTINYGESYDKLPRVVPYAIIPFGAAMILLRIVQATLRILKGQDKSLIVSHEAEDDVERVALAAAQAQDETLQQDARGDSAQGRVAVGLDGKILKTVDEHVSDIAPQNVDKD